MKDFVKRTLENILTTITENNTLMPQMAPETQSLEKREIDTIYGRVSDVLGDKKAIIIGGAALQRYSSHKPKDIDLLVDNDFADYIQRLKENGFSDMHEKRLKPFFRSDIYVSSYNLNGNMVRVEFYSPDGILNKNEKFMDAANRARFTSYKGKRVYYGDPYTMIVSKYNSWKNRVFNGRADKDLLDLKEAGFDAVDSDMREKLEKAYHQGFISRSKSLASDVLRLVYHGFISHKY